jgi:hypothetical protein
MESLVMIPNDGTIERPQLLPKALLQATSTPKKRSKDTKLGKQRTDCTARLEPAEELCLLIERRVAKLKTAQPTVLKVVNYHHEEEDCHVYVW